MVYDLDFFLKNWSSVVFGSLSSLLIHTLHLAENFEIALHGYVILDVLDTHSFSVVDLLLTRGSVCTWNPQAQPLECSRNSSLDALASRMAARRDTDSAYRVHRVSFKRLKISFLLHFHWSQIDDDGLDRKSTEHSVFLFLQTTPTAAKMRLVAGPVL